MLLVDFDPQGSLSVGLGVNPHTLEHSIYNLMLTRDVTIGEVIDRTSTEGVDLLPSNIDLAAALPLVSEVAREQTLARVLKQVKGDYDVILVDCAPSLGLLTIDALTAADWVLMPLECEFFALRGIALLHDTIGKVQDRLNPDLKVLGILGTMYDPRTLHSREVLDRVVQAFGDQVFHTVIRRTVKFPETTVAGETRCASASVRRVPPRTGCSPARCSTGAGDVGGTARRADRGSFDVHLTNFDGPFDLLLQLIGQRRLRHHRGRPLAGDRRLHRPPQGRGQLVGTSTRRPSSSSSRRRCSTSRPPG